MPFSAGSRNCIGGRYAMIGMKIMLSYIVRRFRMSTKQTMTDMRFRFDLTLKLESDYESSVFGVYTRMMFFLWSLILVLALVVWLVNVLLQNSFRFGTHLPRMEPYYPIIGNGLVFFGKSGNEMFDAFIKPFAEFEGWFQMWLGPKLVVSTSHPDIMQAVLMHPDCLEKPFIYDFAKLEHGLFGVEEDSFKNSHIDLKFLVLSTDHTWKSQRKALNPSFNVRILNSFIPVFIKCSNLLVNNLEKAVDQGGKMVSVLPYISKCTLEMVCGTTIGCDVLERSGKDTLLHNIDRCFELVAKRTVSVHQYADVLYRFMKDCAEEAQCRTLGCKYIDKIVELAKNQIKNVEDIESQEDFKKPQIFVNQLLSVKHNGNPFTDEEIAHNIYTIIVAESLRLAPSGPNIARQTMRDVEVGGLLIPSGNMIWLSIYAMHRRKDIWGPDADRFDPDRFLPERSDGRNANAFMPFSSGSRNCIGIRYAMIGMKIMLSYIVRRFRMSTKQTMADLRFRLDMTLKLDSGYDIFLERRL
uniref:Uncharacterized protein n=1 Tax=Anopheles albimanus TaxID=7167 RepID=A0A182FAN8_ANOAL